MDDYKECGFGEANRFSSILVYCKNQEYCENQMNFGNKVCCKVPLDKDLEKKVESE